MEIEKLIEKTYSDDVREMVLNDEQIKDHNEMIEFKLSNLHLPDLRNLQYCDLSVFTLEELEFLKEKLEFYQGYYSTTEKNEKVRRNGIYGASGNRHYRFYNIDVAADITAEARNMIDIVKSLTNNAFNGKKSKETSHKSVYKYSKEPVLETFELDELGIEPIEVNEEERDYIAYGDTDSNYIDIGSFIDKVKFKPDSPYKDNMVEFIVQYDKIFLDKYIQGFIKDYVGIRGGVSHIVYENEKICDLAVFTNKKKNYALNVLWSDGKYLKEPKLTVVGVMRKHTSDIPRSYIKKILDELMVLGELDNVKIYKLINQFKEEFKTLDFAQKCKIIAIKKYDDYVVDDKDSLSFLPRVSPQIRGAAAFNYAIRDKGLLNKYALLTSSDRVASYMCDSGFYSDAFSYLATEKIPDFAPKLDDDKQFADLVMNPLEPFILTSGLQKPSKEGFVNVGMW